jgi:rhodanese-related sulfurtransferase
MPQKSNKPNIKPSSYQKKPQRKTHKRNNWQKWTGFGIAVVIIIVAIILIVPRVTGVAHISVAEAYQRYQQGTYFLDVRTQAEWNQAHIPNSKLIPLDDLQNQLTNLPKGREIIVVCLTGHRSDEGATILQKAGFSTIVSMTGGLTAWNARGYPLEGSNP